MNIPELGPLYGNRDVTRRETTEKTDAAGENIRTAPRETEETDAAAEETAPRDVFSASEDRRRIDDLVETAEDTGEEIREDRVEQARQRVASGYYNSEEFLGRLALQITATGEI